MQTEQTTNHQKPWQDPLMAHVSGFRTGTDDLSYHIDASQIRGKIPETLQGIFLRNGPARNELAGKKFGHWFDGDGCVHTFRIENGAVDYRCSFVKTPKYVDETEAQQVRYRSYGHNAPGGFFRNLHMPANAANTSIVYHGGKLLTLFEGGLPWRLDLDTLATIGPEDFDGALKGMDTFSAHGKLHPRTGDYFNFGMGGGLKGPQLSLYQIDQQGKMARRGNVAIDSMAFCHDNAMTENYLVFMVMPVTFGSLFKVITARDTIDNNMAFRAELGMKVYVVALEDFSLVRTFEVEPFMYAHSSNCWEKDGELFIDVVAMNDEDAEVGTAFSRNLFSQPRPATGAMRRFRFNLNTGASSTEALPCAVPCEFPQWDMRRTGQESRFIYTAGICENETPGFYNAIQRIDLLRGEASAYDCGPARYTSEPIFVPRSPDADEGDGYILAVIYDANTKLSELLILDATNLDEEIASVPLRNHIPHGFHCGFTALP
ncbi:lignostilbene alpha-beta-dioxygenase [Halieaceae bacterium IMCC14734]|uniref:Lignostilbene alpha-beta-dioxygenase n=1 Tax=Candidatus Litorirhabdus singularis TaxID=2518993 RepID=A0ABT3TFI4_9GAMM|nr:carotenoid oxygenase family protein [Candidatus Litorirhabdus singularis]MCX2981071.1 lignostilbene alpha-beta-dioxygenase [Candidatus Litorirhabdus singularis]